MRPTGSKIHRIWKCQASAVLPQSGTYQPEFEPFRAKGKAVHAFLHQAGKIGRAAALASVTDEEVANLCEALQLEDLPVGLATEVSFAWDWQAGTARELGRDLPLRPGDGGVDYDHPSIQPPVDWSREIPATLDVVGVQRMVSPGHELMPPTRGYVGDYKSGHSKYPAPDMFGQTLLGALCVASVYGCDDVVVELIHIHDNGGHHSVRRTVNSWDLQVFADELHEAMCEVIGTSRTVEWIPEQHEGPWCDYCPAYKACPAKVALVRAIPQELVQLGVRPGPEGLELTPGSLTVRNAALAWMAIERIEDVLARAKEEICGIGAFEAIPLHDGRVIGRLVTERKATVGRVAAELLEERYGRAEREERTTVKVTLAALRQAVVAHIQQGQKIETRDCTGEYDKLLAELDRRGGIELKVTDAVRPHVPKKKLGAGG